MRTRVGGLCREGSPRFARECSGPRPHRLEGHAGRAIRAPSTLHKGLVEARAISDSFKWTNAERAEGERPADIQTAE
jgi:hypothetical protein